MATYLIGYDLHEGEDYEDLIDAIKAIAGGWWRHLDSTWIITHDGPSVAIRDALKGHISSGDKLLVLLLDSEGAWRGFSDRASEWLKQHL